MTPREAVGAPVTIIRPSSGWVGLKLDELWRYRELLYFLTWRDIKVRYRQTVLGVTWVLIQPLFTTVVFAVIFGRLAGIPSDGKPYPVFALAGLLPWQLFSHALTESSSSIVANQNLVTKVYFPRLVIPLSAVLASLLDFGIAFVALVAMMAYYGIVPTAAAATLPLFLLLVVALAVGVGAWLSALNVRYRDVRYAVPFMIQAWLFVTPIAYPSSLVPERWRLWCGLNPLVGVVEGFRWALLETGPPPVALVVLSTIVAAVILVSGLHFFRRTERSFADTI